MLLRPEREMTKPDHAAHNSSLDFPFPEKEKDEIRLKLSTANHYFKNRKKTYEWLIWKTYENEIYQLKAILN